jgi:hypothetical protein
MEEQRAILNQMIEQGADYDAIVKQSQIVDKLIVRHYSAS